MGRDSGVLDESLWEESMSACDGAITSDWEMVAAVTANDTSDHNWDEIQEGEQNIWEFVTHFEERPENLIHNDCWRSQYNKPEPHNFRCTIEIADSENYNELFFHSPQPADDADDESGNDILGRSLDIIQGTGNAYISAGAALIDYAMSDSSNSTSVDNNDNKSKFIFDIDLDGGYDDLPQVVDGEPESVGVSLRVRNDYSSDYHGIKYIPEHTFTYPSQRNDRSPCGCETPTYYYKTTVPNCLPFATYEAVP